MLIASEKFYRLERDFYYGFTAFLLGTAQVFIESKSTGKIVKVTNSDRTTNRPSWSSNYVETANVVFPIRETGDYRVIVSLKADINEGAMFNLQSIEKKFMNSYHTSSYYISWSTRNGCGFVCPRVNGEADCDSVENTGCNYYR